MFKIIYVYNNDMYVQGRVEGDPGGENRAMINYEMVMMMMMMMMMTTMMMMMTTTTTIDSI